MHLPKLFYLAALLSTTASALPQGGHGPRPQIRPPQNPAQVDPPPPARGGHRGKGSAPPPPPATPAPPPPPPAQGGTGGGNAGTGGGAAAGGGAGEANGNVPSQVNTAVIPTDFGIKAGSGLNKVQAGACTGANNAPIPCNCPPAPNDPAFLGSLTKSLTQGFFPDQSVKTPITLAKFNDASDTSVQTNRDRATAMVQVLQSLSGNKGQGCPGVSYPVLVNQQKTGQLGSAAVVGAAGK